MIFSFSFCHFNCVKAVADIIRTTLGPRSMLKMLLDAGGGNFPFCISIKYLHFRCVMFISSH